MDLANEILKQHGLEYEDLNYDEREWINAINLGSQAYTLADFKDDLTVLVTSLSLQLAQLPDDEAHNHENTMLKARLNNYLVLQAKLTAPEKAEKFLRRALENRKKNQGVEV